MKLATIHPVLPETHPLIETATKPLADNAEQRLAANGLLGETFDPDHPGVGEAIDRFEKVDGKRRANGGKGALWVTVGLALAFAGFSHRPEIRLAESIYGSSLFDLPEPAPLPDDLTERERLLFGDPDLDFEEQRRRLHLFEPENPAFYVEYAGAYLSAHDDLPEDYLDTVARIAPQNAFFLYLAAAEIGQGSFERERSSSAPTESRIVDGVNLPSKFREQDYTVVDRESFDRAISLIEKASELSEFETFTQSLMAERSGILPDERMADYLYSMVHVYSPAWGIINIRKAADLMSARAYELSESGRKDEFIVLTQQREAFMAGLARNKDITLVGELIYNVIGSGTAVCFRAAADRLGLDDLEETYRAQMDGFQAVMDNRRIRQAKETDPFPLERAGILVQNILPALRSQVSSPPPISESDLRPMRLAEHDVALRLGIASLAIILLVASGVVWLGRALVPKATRRLGIRMVVLLRPADWAWVVGCGIVPPIAVYLLLNRFSAFGGRDFHLDHFLYPPLGIQLLTMLMSLLLMPALVIRWRLSERLAPFGFRAGGIKLPLVVLISMLVWSLAIYPLVQQRGTNIFEQAALFSGPFLWVGFLVFNLGRIMLGKPQQRIMASATSTALVPAYAIAIITLCLTLPVFIASEKHWLAKETLYRIDPDAPDLGAYEFKVAAEKRKETKAILGIE